MRPLLLLSLAALASAAPAFGWGCEGHQIVALIARAHLTPAAAAAVDRMLGENPSDAALNHFCKSADPMADTATWADEVRNAEKSGKWHYVDIPLTEKKPGSLAPWCPPIGPSAGGQDRPGCVVNAIEYNWDILLDTSRPPAERTTALRYIIHFVGDMHQPLHSSDNDDQGGNCTSMKFFDEERPANLHSIWDSKLIQHELAAKKETAAEYARRLDREYSDRWQAWGTGAIDPSAWAWENNKVARQFTYGDLKPAIAIEQPDPKADCKVEREKVTALKIVIGDAYFNSEIPVVGEQLAKAGYRLADLLNRTF
jgi:hypothetical protein